MVGAAFGVERFAEIDWRPRYNVAPTQDVAAIRRADGQTLLDSLRWGFVPSFAPDTSLAPINARSETVATSPMFRDAFRHRRCVVVADGFYEWRKDGARKTPYFVHLRTERPFGFAGIWSAPRASAGAPVATCAILTCPPNELMATIHNRMPVILPAVACARWLDTDAREAQLRDLLVPLPSDAMDAYVVTRFVNSPRNDSPECVRRA